MKKTILVAEDDPGIRRLLEVILSSMGAEKVEFTICENGAVALEAAMAGSYDLVITDLVMPEMNGYDLVSALRGIDQYADTPVIFLTGSPISLRPKKPEDFGGTYIQKPFDVENFMYVVNTALISVG